MRQSLWDKLEAFPPIVCRLLARTKTPSGGVRAMTSREIADRAGMSESDINSLSWKTSWSDVIFAKIRPFTEACGVDLTNREICRMQSAYIRRGASFKYLKRSRDWINIYKPMIIVYVTARTNSNPATTQG